MVGTLIVSIENVDLITAASTVAACLGNVGPGFGEVGPLSSYSLYSDATTVFLSLLMITGRLELFTILLLFMPGFWDTNR
jgi:trk system potassium uptake protein TrkH